MAARYALYYAPSDDSAFAAFGATWLGRDAASGERRIQPTVAGLTADRLAALTDDPRRYGFHGTLKPPFALADGTTEPELFAALDAFAATSVPVVSPPLCLAAIGHFLALIPRASSPGLDALAEAAVRHFDRFRRPAGADELARRRRSGLTARQDAYLETWGYPYVMEEFRFHLTLTGPVVDDGERAALIDYLSEATRPFTECPFTADELTLFVQSAPDQPFRIIRRVTARGAAQAADRVSINS